jgi:hypothetical protein
VASREQRAESGEELYLRLHVGRLCPLYLRYLKDIAVITYALQVGHPLGLIQSKQR